MMEGAEEKAKKDWPKIVGPEKDGTAGSVWSELGLLASIWHSG